MDWSKLKSALGTALPAIASVVGTPLAGGAVKALCNVFGLKDDASPDDIAAAYATATPEQLVRLKELESNERIRMEEIAVYEQVRNNELTVADKESARNVKDMTTVVMTYLITLGFFAATFFIASKWAEVTKEEASIFFTLVGILASKWSSVVDFWFGTSFSSRKKDELIANRHKDA